MYMYTINILIVEKETLTIQFATLDDKNKFAQLMTTKNVEILSCPYCLHNVPVSEYV